MPNQLHANILLVGAEVAPLAKVGGLGDVIGSLPRALNGKVESIAIAAPFHAVIHQQHLPKLRLVMHLQVPFAKTVVPATVWQTVLPDSQIPVYLFEHSLYLSQGEIYPQQQVWDPLHKRWAGQQSSEVIRYLFFSQAVFEFIKATQQFNLIHLNDWHTSAVAALLKLDPLTKSIRTVFTIHNTSIAHGISTKFLQLLPWQLSKVLTPYEQLTSQHIQGNILLRVGIKFSDAVTTVSPQYAKDLLTKRYGNGLHKLLAHRRKNVLGILNGLDEQSFNPASDSVLEQHYTAKTLEKKVKNKLYLQRILGFSVSESIPLCGVVSRMDRQKGITLMIETLPQFLKQGVQCVIAGVGNPRLEQHLKKLQVLFPNQFYLHDTFDLSFSQQIYGAADIFLMPSLYEPCGLSQLIAMRYGAVPVVRATGGLKDTVHNKVNGFTFNAYSSKAFRKTLQRAITTYKDEPKTWQRLMRNGMTKDYSWDSAVPEYLKVYRKLLK